MSTRKSITYSEELKHETVMRYLNGESPSIIANELGIRDTKRIRIWAKKFQNGELLSENRGKASGIGRGRPRTKFASLEEENEYLKAELAYLKKRYSYLFNYE